MECGGVGNDWEWIKSFILSVLWVWESFSITKILIIIAILII